MLSPTAITEKAKEDDSSDLKNEFTNWTFNNNKINS